MIAEVLTARRHGIRIPTRAWRASVKAGVPFYVTCALLMQESGGGQNIFGHDPTIFVGAGKVTKTNYLRYKAARKAGGGMQGVGPAQLTWWEFQDRADAAGGCWRPYVNLLTGLQVLAGLCKATGSWVEAARRYNGSGPAADIYAAQMADRFVFWKRVLS